MLRQTSNAYPDNEIVSPLDTSVDFTIEISGTVCQKYELRIYKYSTAALKKTYTVSLDEANYVYDGETLTVVVDMTDANLGADDYYWIIDCYWDKTDLNAYITSLPFSFSACSNPTIALSPTLPTTITSQSYQFKATYTQAQGKQISWWTAELYDTGGIKLKDSNDVNGKPKRTQYIKYTFDGFLSNVQYGIRIFGENEVGQTFDTGILYFDVVYSAPTATVSSPTVTLREDGSAYIGWDHIVYRLGIVTGSSNYVSNFNYSGNTALHLASGAYVVFAVDVLTSTLTYVADVKFDATSFTGDALKIYDVTSGDYISVGYNGSRWYVDKNGTVEYAIPEALTTNNYIVAIKSNGTDIFQYHKAKV